MNIYLLITIIILNFFISSILSYVYNIFIISIYAEFKHELKPAVSIRESYSGNVYFLGTYNKQGYRVLQLN